MSRVKFLSSPNNFKAAKSFADSCKQASTLRRTRKQQGNPNEVTQTKMSFLCTRSIELNCFEKKTPQLRVLSKKNGPIETNVLYLFVLSFSHESFFELKTSATRLRIWHSAIARRNFEKKTRLRSAQNMSYYITLNVPISAVGNSLLFRVGCEPSMKLVACIFIRRPRWSEAKAVGSGLM